MAEDSAPSVEQMALASLNDGVSTPFAKSEFSNRVLIRTILSRADGGAGLAGQTVKVGGWVKPVGSKGRVHFLFLTSTTGPARQTFRLSWTSSWRLWARSCRPAHVCTWRACSSSLLRGRSRGWKSGLRKFFSFFAGMNLI